MALERWRPHGGCRPSATSSSRWRSSSAGEMRDWAPAIDMMDRKEKIVLRADLPGLEQKDVEVSVENNTLTVRGERKAEKKTKDEDYYACERRTGAFFRSVTLPPGVDARRCAPRSGTGCWRCTSRRRTRHGPRRSRGHLRGPATTDR